MKDITDIVEEIINNLDYTIEIKSVDDLGNDLKQLNVCKTLHIQPDCTTVTINGTQYQVGEILNNQWIQITTPDTINEGDIINVDPPKYFHGTIPATNDELSQIMADSDKLPMVYLYEIIRQKYFYNDEQPLEVEAQLRLFFLAGSDFGSWYTDDHYKNAIKPMTNLTLLFSDYINNNNCQFQELDEVEIINHAKWGVWRDNKGHEKNLFNDKLSGTELRINLQINKDLASGSCNC